MDNMPGISETVINFLPLFLSNTWGIQTTISGLIEGLLKRRPEKAQSICPMQSLKSGCSSGWL